MIQVDGLTRRFGDRLAVEDLSFSLGAGQLCALLGPNGAGKTTTVRMLLGLIKPTRGTATVAEFPIPGPEERMAALRARVGLLTETPGFYDRLSALENLTLFARLYGIDTGTLHRRLEEHLTPLGLWHRRHDVVATFSKGMKQKLAVVRAVFHEPDVVFFDEPTAGLDPESARVVRRMIASLKAAGRTIIVCTHNLSEAAELADVVAVIRGRLVALGPPHALGRAGQPARYRVTLATPADSAHRIVLGVDGVREVHGSGSRFEFEVADVPASIPRIVAGLVHGGHEVLEVRELERSLEDAYLEVIREDE